jgi:Domain of unknown function (DUF4405)
MKQTNRNFWLDVSIFMTFVLTAFTGIFLWLLIPHQSISAFLGFNRHFWLTAHICFGLISVAGSVVHVIWHRLWLKALRRRRIASLPPKIRSNRVMDRFEWITFLVTFVFGMLDWIMPVRENSITIFTRLHVAVGIACMLGITVHLALHTKWIISTIQSNLQLKREDIVIIQHAGAKNLSISNH